MTREKLPKKEEKTPRPKVLRVDGHFFVETSEGSILYKVTPDENGRFSCACKDYAEGIKNNPRIQCKHILEILHSVPKGDVEKGESLEKRKLKLDERFVKTIEGRDFVLYSGLLDLAHQNGLLKLEVDPIQYPTQENGNTAICKAVGISKAGETFIDIGDADPWNCDSKVAKHLLRMASTRAKARVLRDMTNIGMTCLEELGDLEEVLRGEPSGQSKFKGNFSKEIFKSPEPTTVEKTIADKENGCNQGSENQVKPESEEPKSEGKHDPGPIMSSAQKNAIYNLGSRRRMNHEELEKMAQQDYGVPLENLSSENASAFIRILQKSPPGTSNKAKANGQEKVS